MTAVEFAKLVKNPRRRPGSAWWDARCPAHDDRRSSLSFRDGDEGLVVECHARCSFEQIAAAVGRRPADFFHARDHDRRIVATYNYEDERGELLFQVVRFEPKDFRCRRPDGRGGWLWNLDGVRIVPYRLHELAEARRVYIPEGERDCDTLAALGLTATTNHGGAGKWRPEHTAALVAAAVPEIVVLRDNDRPGAAHQDAVAKSCAAAGLRVKRLELPGLPPLQDKHGEDASDWLAAGHDAAELKALADAAPVFDSAPAAAGPGISSDGIPADYIESVAAFLAEEDPPLEMVFPELLPRGVIMLLHGEPRARKSLAGFELALSAATGTAPFGLTRLKPPTPIDVLYVQEEDPRSLTRPRLRKLVDARCGNLPPATLHVAVRRGIDLDDPAWVARLIEDLKRLDVKLLVLDAARRLSAKTDEGPAKVRELIAVLRSIVIAAEVTIVIVHHDIKPARDGQDQRRRGQRASGGDWFAASECPVHVERVGKSESLFFPEDFKFTDDPAPFVFSLEIENGLVVRLVGADTTSEQAERVGVRGKVLDWLRANGPASKSAMKNARLGRWETIEAALDHWQKEGKVDSGPGRKAGSIRYFVVGGEPEHRLGSDSTGAHGDAR